MSRAALLTGPYTHLDHLGVLAALLEIPLIVTEEKTYTLGKKFYPDLEIEWKEPSELSLEYLAQNFTVLFHSGKFLTEQLLPFFKLLHNKQMRLVYCPHGNSDKGEGIIDPIKQDVSLIYGNHMLAHLEKTKAPIQQTIVIGNYRYSYYLKHKAFYEIDIPQNTIFYAPTWDNTSFFSTMDALAKNLRHYHLLVKLHPLLEEYYPAHVLHIIQKYENHPQITIIEDYPPIYPLLDKAAIYLGDHSSIGYDFLAFDKPMYFLTENKNLALDQCGLHVPKDSDIISFIEGTKQESFSKKRKEVYDYVFSKQEEGLTHSLHHLNSLQ